MKYSEYGFRPLYHNFCIFPLTDKMKEVVFAWKELFNEASEEFILLGFFNKKLDDYERWKCNKKQVIESLKKLIILCDKARKNNKIIRCRKITIKAQ